MKHCVFKVIIPWFQTINAKAYLCKVEKKFTAQHILQFKFSILIIYNIQLPST